MSDPVGRDRLTRWRLVLGKGAGLDPPPGGDGTGEGSGSGQGIGPGEGPGEGPGPDDGDDGAPRLSADDRRRDEALSQLYDAPRSGGLGASAPRVARWLGDVRTYFPTSVVQVLQHDAMDRLGLHQLLLEPEMMEAVQPDVHLVSTLVGLNGVIPPHSRETARAVVRTVTAELEERLRQKTVQAVTGALDRAARSRRPKPADINWPATVTANLKHWLPEHRTVVPERLVGHARRARSLERHVILCLDQSGSMAESVVYSSVFGAVLASLRSLSTSIVAFDTAVVDLSDLAEDPVDVLFGVQLGGGTDINKALAYCQSLVRAPEDTVLVLVSDLLEGGIADDMVRRARDLVAAGVTVVALLALSDSGAPAHDADHAAALAEVGVPAFACTPDLFPDLMAAAIERRDLTAFAATHDLPTAAPGRQ
ncbi:VWA domain-containing protein [Nocardioides bruguierae]|uniref:VWA domain-containing protein n=1 Tax=Nocardioides bruguierae TaxID=2945102 RepID=UPI00202051DA|nr:VWA domain-containing protein [Nocardioides bruguierae]MCL8026119.1 VWA domain-containing protein [Nocardioides bruguierae]